MIFNLLFQIFISWFTACCLLKVFYITLSVKNTEIYQEPALLTSLLSVFSVTLSHKSNYIASKILHHCMGLCFTTVYYLIWFYEFREISWTASLIIGLINSLLRIISWIFLLEIIPSARLTNFKGYYLQLVFVHNIFTIAIITVYKFFK